MIGFITRLADCRMISKLCPTFYNVCYKNWFTFSSKFKTRADLKKTAGHTDLWQEINQKNVKWIIPESMFLFLSLHFESMDILEGLRENQLKTVMPRGL